MADQTFASVNALINGQLAEIEREVGKFDYTAEWSRRHAEATQRLLDLLTREAGAQFRHRPPHDHAVKILGVRSTSTSGWSGALRNWQRAAGVKMMVRPHG